MKKKKWNLNSIFSCHRKKGWHQGTRIGFHMIAMITAIADFFHSDRSDHSDNSDHIESRDVKNKIMLKKK